MSFLFGWPTPSASGFSLAALAVCLALPAWAEPAPPFRLLIAQAAGTPPAIEASFRLDAAQARSRQAQQRTNPDLSLEVENVLGDGSYAAFGNAETTLALSQELDLWGRRRAVRAAAISEAEAAAIARDEAVLEGASKIARAYAEAEAADRRHDLLQEALALALADAAAADALVKEGREPTLRALQARSDAASAQAQFDEARADREAAFARLTAAAGLRSRATSISDSLLDVTPPFPTPSQNSFGAVRRAQAEQAAAESRIGLERAAGRPSPTASLGVRRFSGEDASALTFGVSVGLPLFNQNRNAVEAAQADLRAAGARLAGLRAEMQAELEAAQALANAAAKRVSAADISASSAAEAYRLSRIGAEAGRISQLELRVTRAAYVNAKIAAVNARLARAVAHIDLVRLEGRIPYGEVQ